MGRLSRDVLVAMAMVVVVVAIVLEGARAVDRKAFKTCAQSGFCRRQRDFAAGVVDDGVAEGRFRLEGDAGTPRPGVRAFDVRHDGSGKRYSLEVTNYQEEGRMLRVRLREKQGVSQDADGHVHPAYEIPFGEVLSPSLRAVPLGDAAASGRLFGGRLSLTDDPLTGLQLAFYGASQEEPSIVVNQRGLWNLEQRRRKLPSNDDSADTPLDGWEDDGGERFSTHKDSQPYGRSSVGVDVSFKNKEHVYGIPEHASSFSLKTTVDVSDPYRLYNLDVFEYEVDETMALYGSIPFMIGHSDKETSAIFWHNASETWIDIEHEIDDEEEPYVDTHWFSESGVVDFVVLLGPTPKEVMGQYGRLTGYPEVPPMFALGYHQSKWNYRDQEDVLEVNDGFDRHDMPADVIWLDIEHTDGKAYFTWDGTKFPDPAAMVEEVGRRSGRRMVTIVDPHIKKKAGYAVYEDAKREGLFVGNPPDGREDYEGWCWPGASYYLDFSNPDVRTWWGNHFQWDSYVGSTPLLFTWNDMNEPSVFNGPEVTMHKDRVHWGGVEHRDLHNLYGMWVHRATSDGLARRISDDPAEARRRVWPLLEAAAGGGGGGGGGSGSGRGNGGRGNGGGGGSLLADAGQMVVERPFVLSRAFFAGSQRGGTAVWTGDNTAAWDHLEAAQPMLLSMSVAGLPFVGADVGGFFGDPDPELLERWYQAGAFHPFYRGHCHLDSRRREPWLMGGETTAVIRKALRQRYAHLPLWYTLFFEGSVTGVPPMRPLWMEFPHDRRVFPMEQQFMVGDTLLVRPVTKAGQRQCRVYFPSEAAAATTLWYDVETLKTYVVAVDAKEEEDVASGAGGGGQWGDVACPRERIPVFQRGGTILPRKDRTRRSTTSMVADPYTLVVALDAAGRASGRLYVDDGRSYQYAASPAASAYVEFRFQDGTLTVHPASLPASYPDGPAALNGHATNGDNNNGSSSGAVTEGGAVTDGLAIERITILGLQSRPHLAAVFDSPDAEEGSAIDMFALTPPSSTHHHVMLKKPNIPVTGSWEVRVR